jgi:hypothetical protein
MCIARLRQGIEQRRPARTRYDPRPQPGGQGSLRPTCPGLRGEAGKTSTSGASQAGRSVSRQLHERGVNGRLQASQYGLEGIA